MLKRNFMRTGLVLLAATLGLGTFQPLAAQGTSIKIGVVDLDAVVAQSSAGKELQAQLDKFQKEVQAEGEKMSAEANAIRKQATDGGATLSQEKLSELQEQYDEKANAIRRFRDDKQKEGQQIQAKGLRKIEDQLKPIFEKVRDEGGYDIILNNVPGVVLLINARVDLTAEVIKRVNGTP
jgi:Skp family chaperone for outer membrane proteins